jgi:hypothetical protein
MTDTEILRKFEAIKQQHEEADSEQRRLLGKLGWEYTSDTPNNCWMYRKAFPVSDQFPEGATILCDASMAEDIETANLDRDEFDAENEE